MNEIINNEAANLTDDQIAKLMAVIHDGAPDDEVVVEVAADEADKQSTK